jgi:hypothetical protein
MSGNEFHERVLPGFGFFLMMLLLPLAIWLVLLPLNPPLGAVLGVASYALVGLIAYLRSPKIEVTHDQLRVNQAGIPLTQIGKPIIVDPEDAFVERGLRLDARAFTSFQSGVATLVRVPIVDKRDNTPYWLFSVRNVSGLVSALDANRP